MVGPFDLGGTGGVQGLSDLGALPRPEYVLHASFLPSREKEQDRLRNTYVRQRTYVCTFHGISWCFR